MRAEHEHGCMRRQRNKRRSKNLPVGWRPAAAAAPQNPVCVIWTTSLKAAQSVVAGESTDTEQRTCCVV